MIRDRGGDREVATLRVLWASPGWGKLICSGVDVMSGLIAVTAAVSDGRVSTSGGVSQEDGGM